MPVNAKAVPITIGGDEVDEPSDRKQPHCLQSIKQPTLEAQSTLISPTLISPTLISRRDPSQSTLESEK